MLMEGSKNYFPGESRVWIFFCSAHGNPWWSRLLAKDFSHCFMIKEQVLYDVPLYIRLEGLTHCVINDVQMVLMDDIIKLTRENSRVGIVRILKGTIDNNYTKPYNQFEFMTCVTLLKKTLGVNKPLVITPKQLFTYLQTINYKEI